LSYASSNTITLKELTGIERLTVRDDRRECQAVKYHMRPECQPAGPQVWITFPGRPAVEDRLR